MQDELDGTDIDVGTNKQWDTSTTEAKKDDPKFRALLLRREEGYLPPERLWEDGTAAPVDGILAINELHRNGRITFREWLRFVREWMDNVAQHYGTPADVERIRNTPKPE